MADWKKIRNNWVVPIIGGILLAVIIVVNGVISGEVSINWPQ